MPKIYKTVSGDMWDGIAYKEMGSELYTSQLLNANPAERYRYIFTADVVLKIPERDEKAIEGMPPWKKASVIYG
jgi:phage tail protein X